MRKIPSSEALKAIALIVLDCDGVLTDRGLLYDENGTRLLRFDARDGFGLALFTRHSGKKAAILSGRPTDIAHHRFAELGLNPIRGRSRDKAKDVLEICTELNVEPRNTAFVGDDLPDLPAMAQVGIAIAVADAAPEVKAITDWQLESTGGHGAILEVCETILKATGDWQTWLAKTGYEPSQFQAN